MSMWNEMDPVPGSVGEPDSLLYGARNGVDGSFRVLEPESADGGDARMGLAELRRALRELHGIHRAEQALLLSQVAEFRLAAIQRSADRFPLFGPALGAPGQASWERALRDERRFARADGVPFAPMLEAIYRRSAEGVGAAQVGPRGGPGGDAGNDQDAMPRPRESSAPLRRALELASAAVALEPWLESRLTLARILTAHGAHAAAARELTALEHAPGVDWSSPAARVLRTAIIGHEAVCAAWRGDPGRALGLFVAQLERNPEFHGAAMTMALALTLGEHDAFERGTRVVGMLHRGSRGGSHPDWARVAACLRSHARMEGLRVRIPASAAVDLLRQADPWTRKIVSLLLGGR